MADRETILAALFTALQTIPTSTSDEITFERNRVSSIEEMNLPAIIMWDGDEESQSPGGRALNRGAPIQSKMQPEIWAFVREQNGQNIGTTINAMLVRIKAAVFGNAALKAAIGDSGTTVLSITTGLGRGKTKAGDVSMTLAITYLDDPT